MGEIEYFLNYARERLNDAERQLLHEQLIPSRAILQQSIDNYREWIVKAEARLGRKEAA
ncbi:MAG: hypothetical protein AAF679_03705 [Pseudomonadota bacterium]